MRKITWLSVAFVSLLATVILYRCSSSCGEGIFTDSCPTGRYTKEIFTDDDYPSSFAGGPDSPIEVTYGQNYSDTAYLWDNNAANDDLTQIEDLKMDIYLPPPADTFTKRPVMVLVHGGGFSGGDKLTSGMTKYAKTFAKSGWVAISTNYRLYKKAKQSNKYNFIVQQQGYDVKAAIRWIRKHADEYGVDPERIGVGGGSAGGYLAIETGYNTNPNDDPAENGEGDSNDLFTSDGIDSKVLAVMDLSGGTVTNVDEMVDAGDPPAVIVHCLGDPTVFIEEAHDFIAALKADGIFYDDDDNLIPGNHHGAGTDNVLPVVQPFLAKYVAGVSVSALPTMLSTGVTSCPETGSSDDN